MDKGFKPGDKVQLKSGGPTMTVDKLITQGFESDKYRCQWFSGSNLKQGYFAYDSLKKVDDVFDRLDV